MVAEARLATVDLVGRDFEQNQTRCVHLGAVFDSGRCRPRISLAKRYPGANGRMQSGGGGGRRQFAWAVSGNGAGGGSTIQAYRGAGLAAANRPPSNPRRTAFERGRSGLLTTFTGLGAQGHLEPFERGTNHAWVNTGSEKALMMGVLVDNGSATEK
jgi:hypothetical protein